VTDSKHRLWTLANGITFGRLLLLYPLFAFLRRGEDGNLYAMVVIGAALLTDMLDGLIARLMHQESDWGKVLDPVADKIWIGCLALFLAMPWREHPLPWPFLVLLFLRDIAILVAGWIAYSRTGGILMSNWYGKITMVACALTVISYTIYWEPETFSAIRPETIMWLTVVMIFVSGGSYTHRLRRVLAEHDRRPQVPARLAP
jgi:phosphatidylglycerophosphate synthase